MADYQHPSLENLVPALDGKFDLNLLAEEIVEDYQTDREARQDWEAMHAKWVRLHYQKDKPVSRRRWRGASSESLPTLTEAVHQYHTRMYDAMFANRRLVKGLPTGRVSEKDNERAERVGLHMTWQLTIQDRNYRRNKDRLLLALPLHGTMFTKGYHDHHFHRNVVKNVRPIDLMVPYGVGPRSMEDVERKTELIWTTVNNTRHLARSGFLADEGLPTDHVADELSAPEIAIEDATGMREPARERDENRPVLLLESHRLVDLDGDGIAEPYIVIVDPTARRVLRIAIRWDTDEAGNPVGRDWYDDKKPIEYYTPWHFYENPDGFYGLGLGHTLGELNQATNRLMREIIDAGMLATIGNMSGFINSALSGPHGGDLEIDLGRFAKVNASGDDINKGIYTFKFPGPSQALFNALQLLLMRSDRLGLNTEAVTGQLERALQPTTILALLEQSSQSFGSVNERVIHAWGDELALLYALNGQHLPVEEYFAVLDIDGEMIDGTIARADYAPDLAVVPMMDPKARTEQERLQRAQMEYQTLINEPLVNVSPIHRYNVIARLLRAFRSDRISEILPHPAGLDVNQMGALLASMAYANTDETGLPNDGRAGEAALAGGTGLGGQPGDEMGVLGGGGSVPATPVANGGDVGPAQ